MNIKQKQDSAKKKKRGRIAVHKVSRQPREEMKEVNKVECVSREERGIKGEEEISREVKQQ